MLYPNSNDSLLSAQLDKLCFPGTLPGMVDLKFIILSKENYYRLHQMQFYAVAGL